MKMEISTRGLCIFLFQCAYIADAVLGSDPRLYVFSKGITVFFWGAMILYIARELKFKIHTGVGFSIALMFTLFCASSCLWAVNKDLAISQMNTQWQLFLLFLFTYILMRETGDVEPYFQAIYFAGFAMLLFAIYRYGKSGFFQQMLGGVRMGGEITNENTFGMVFSQALIMAFYYYLKSRNKIHFASMAIFLIFALSSGSKKALLMCIVGVIGLSVIYYGLHRIWKTILVVFAVAIAGYYLLQLPLFSVINIRLTSYLSGELNTSDMNRMRFIENGISLIKERPILGWGLQNFRYVTGTDAYSHNNFIEVLVSTGIIGFLLYYSMYLTASWTVIKRFLQQKEVTMILMLILAMISVVFGYGMVQFYSKGTWFFLAVLLSSTDEIRLCNLDE